MVRRPDWMPEAAESWQIFFMAGKACEAASEARESAREVFFSEIDAFLSHHRTVTVRECEIGLAAGS